MSETSPRMGWAFPSADADPWFDEFEDFVLATDASGYAAREDRSLVFAGGGTVQWVLGSETLSWSAAIEILSPIGGHLISVAAGSETLAEGELLYLDLTRQALSNVSATLQKATQVPSSDQAIILCFRRNNRVFFRTGFSLGNGDTSDGLAPTPGSSGGSPLITEDEGIQIEADTRVMDFVGDGVTVTSTAPNDVQVTIPGVEVQKDGGSIETGVDTIDFRGSVTVTNPAPGEVRVEVGASQWLRNVSGFLYTATAGDDVVIGAAAMAGAEKLRVVGDARIEGKLTVTGIIDPTGLIIDKAASRPQDPVAGEAIIWVDSTVDKMVTEQESGGIVGLLGALMGSLEITADDDEPGVSVFPDDGGTRGDIHVDPSRTTPPTAPAAGDIWWDPSSGTLVSYDGVAITTVTSPWEQVSGVVFPDNPAWDVTIGGTAMAGSERFFINNYNDATLGTTVGGRVDGRFVTTAGAKSLIDGYRINNEINNPGNSLTLSRGVAIEGAARGGVLAQHIGVNSRATADNAVISSFTGFVAEVFEIGTGTITGSSVGLQVKDLGSATLVAGVYIDPQTYAGAYGINQQGTDDLNLFRGFVEVEQDFMLAEHADHVSVPAAGQGIIWLKNTTPNTLWFTDDLGGDHQLGVGGAGTTNLTSYDWASDYAYRQQATPVEEVIGQGTLDGSLIQGTAYFRVIVDPQFSVAGTARVRLYDVGGVPGGPAAPVSIVTVLLSTSGLTDAIVALTVGATPGAFQIANSPRYYELTVEQTSAAGDTVYVGSAGILDR
jgi:hypothetical protein